VLWQGLALLVLVLGLSTIFAAVVTAGEAWQEHAQTRWPAVTASVDRCALEEASTRQPARYHIRCRVRYTVGSEPHVASLYSMNVPSPQVWQYPRNQIGPLEAWVDRNPPGTPIVIHYNPANHAKVALVATDMPRGGPRTHNNVKLLEFFAGSFLALLVIARITRPRSLRPTEPYSPDL
jgi:hypothetical protein